MKRAVQAGHIDCSLIDKGMSNILTDSVHVTSLIDIGIRKHG